MGPSRALPMASHDLLLQIETAGNIITKKIENPHNHSDCAGFQARSAVVAVGSDFRQK